MGASKRNEVSEARARCYHCYRPKSSCVCDVITPIEMQTKFVILMHPKEFQKVKNGTGHMTHCSLANSELFVGVDFREHQQVNMLINDKNNLCYVLYPDAQSLRLNEESINAETKQVVIFIIDATWSTAQKLLKVSTNLQKLPKLSFSHEKSSIFEIKQQPEAYCLSTIESTLTIIELLQKHQLESLGADAFEHFLDPFKKMISYQIACIADSKSQHKNAARFKRRS